MVIYKKYEYYDATPDNWIGFDGSYQCAQTFTVGTVSDNEKIDLTNIKISLFKADNPGTIVVDVYSTITIDGSSYLFTDKISTGSIDGAGVTEDSGGDWYDFTVGGTELQPNTTYAMTMTCDAGTVWCLSKTVGGYGGGTAFYGVNDRYWVFGNRDCVFEIWGEAPLKGITSKVVTTSERTGVTVTSSKF